MSRKWMVFQIAAVFTMAVSVLMLVGISFQVLNLNSNQSEANASTATFILMLIGFAIMLTFSFLCIYFLRSKFPDKYILPKVVLSFKVLGILAIVFAGILVLGLAAVIPDLLEKLSNPSQSKMELYIMIGFAVYAAVFTYVFIIGQKMIRFINRAFLANEQAAIDSLGNISP